MCYFNRKTPLLGEGLARWAVQQFLLQIKRQRGLTSFIQHRGVNGKWLNPNNPYDISVSKFFKVIGKKAHFQDDEEFLEEWNDIGRRLLRIVRAIA